MARRSCGREKYLSRLSINIFFAHSLVVVQQCRTCQSIHTGQLDFGEHAKYLRSNDSHPAECLDDEEFSVAEKKLLTARRCTQSSEIEQGEKCGWVTQELECSTRILISSGHDRISACSFFSRTSWNYETFPCARLLVSFCGRFSLSLLTQLLVPKIHA